MGQMAGQESLSLPSIWYSIPEGDNVEVLESRNPKLEVAPPLRQEELVKGL